VLALLASGCERPAKARLKPCRLKTVLADAADLSNVECPSGSSGAGREFVKAGDSVLRCNDIVSDFPQVFRAAIDDGPGFRSQQLAQSGRSYLDPA